MKLSVNVKVLVTPPPPMVSVTVYGPEPTDCAAVNWKVMVPLAVSVADADVDCVPSPNLTEPSVRRKAAVLAPVEPLLATTLTPEGRPERVPTTAPLKAGLKTTGAVTTPLNPRKMEMLLADVSCAVNGNSTLKEKLDVVEYPPAVAVRATTTTPGVMVGCETTVNETGPEELTELATCAFTRELVGVAESATAPVKPGARVDRKSTRLNS